MKISRDINLGLSLRKVFGNDKKSNSQVREDQARQTATANEILKRFFSSSSVSRREMILLADEVGLGKTYVALAVAVSILDAIRKGRAPSGMPSYQPVVIVFTPNNKALHNKWIREAEEFKNNCTRGNKLDWLQIFQPDPDGDNVGNIIEMTDKISSATRAKPVLIIARHGVMRRQLHQKEIWQKRALAVIFKEKHFNNKLRKWCCRAVFNDSRKSTRGDLYDLKKSEYLWDDGISSDLKTAFKRALLSSDFNEWIDTCIDERDAGEFYAVINELIRQALAQDWPPIPLVIIDEIHGLKNKHVQHRKQLERYLEGKVHRILGLSATPFQLYHEELLSVLELRSILKIKRSRSRELDKMTEKLEEALIDSRNKGEEFRARWQALWSHDKDVIYGLWERSQSLNIKSGGLLISQVRPERVAKALKTAIDLENANSRLSEHLKQFVIRHRHARGYREHFVGRNVDGEAGTSRGTVNFQWAPGIEVDGGEELVHYMMMRAVSLAKEEKGLPGLGAELTGSYRHLVETSAVWRRIKDAENPSLRDYRKILDRHIDQPSADSTHRKIAATVNRTLEFFKKGQKTIIFCVYTKTAEAVRDQLEEAINNHFVSTRDRVFGSEQAFENFRRRFFNKREPLNSMIQDHPLLGKLSDNTIGIPDQLKLNKEDLERVAELLVIKGEDPNSDRPDRRLILSAVEHILVLKWKNLRQGKKWLERVFKNCPDLEDDISSQTWLDGRVPLSSRRKSRRTYEVIDPEANDTIADPLDVENEDDESMLSVRRRNDQGYFSAWMKRFREKAVSSIIAPYIETPSVAAKRYRVPLLIEHHGDLLSMLDKETRSVAGHVFRRILMAEEFLLRYLADIEKDKSERWYDFLEKRYLEPIHETGESLRDRVHAYLETLVRADRNIALLEGYQKASENRNVVQLTRGDTQDRDRYFLGFNTPYRPEILISTAVGQEGIDLHRECRHVIHHDLCWNPATIEQRTGRVDRIGSKVERERMGAADGEGPTLEIAIPYLAATYDERMFEELYKRSQLFEVTLGGEFLVDGRIEEESVSLEKRRRKRMGINTEDNEDLGSAPMDESSIVALPPDMVERLRVDLAVWKSPKRKS